MLIGRFVFKIAYVCYRWGFAGLCLILCMCVTCVGICMFVFDIGNVCYWCGDLKFCF